MAQEAQPRKPPGKVVHGPAGNGAVGEAAAVVDRQGGLGELRAGAEEVAHPHPEDRPRPPHEDRRQHPQKVARAQGGGEGHHGGLVGGDLAAEAVGPLPDRPQGLAEGHPRHPEGGAEPADPEDHQVGPHQEVDQLHGKAENDAVQGFVPGQDVHGLHLRHGLHLVPRRRRRRFRSSSISPTLPWRLGRGQTSRTAPRGRSRTLNPRRMARAHWA